MAGKTTYHPPTVIPSRSKRRRTNIKTGFIKIYRLEYSSKNHIIGEKKEPDIDDGNAFII